MKVHLIEIERFALHDGPGIRTTVFLQGCPLRCAWCANPESQTQQTHLLWSEKKCIGCGACAAACPHHAVAMAAPTPDAGKSAHPVFRRGDCVQCGACRAVCPANAIVFSGAVWETEKVISAVLRDRDYYAASGGGVTISGGEPFCQPQACLELLRRCKQEGISTAVETSGDVPLAHLLEAAPWVDLFLYDVKHTDAAEMHRATGGDAARILENLRALVQAGAKVIVRVPVIPGFNASQSAMEEILAQVKSAGAGCVHLLPYHTLGRDKYARLGREYALGELAMLCEQDLVGYVAAGQEMGLEITL